MLAGFRDASLVLHKLESVLLKYNIVLCTLTALLLKATLKECKTLATLTKIKA